jgi:hypothetical protein
MRLHRLGAHTRAPTRQRQLLRAVEMEEALNEARFCRRDKPQQHRSDTNASMNSPRLMPLRPLRVVLDAHTRAPLRQRQLLRAVEMEEALNGTRFCRRDKPQRLRSDTNASMNSPRLMPLRPLRVVLGAHTRAPVRQLQSLRVGN